MNRLTKRINIKYLVLTSLMTILTLFLASGCFYIDTPSASSTPSSNSVNISALTTPGWTLPPIGNQNPPLPDFVAVVAKVKPSVVAINTKALVTNIFGQVTEEGAGSGWILDKEGHIVTNNHVIEGAQSITVSLDDGRTLKASVVGADSFSDLAVLKVDASNLQPADIGDSSLSRIGEWVLAMGNALGQGITAKEGIISRLGVSVQVSSDQTLNDLTETSAAINPGNSGGPLINMSGDVIGITSAKFSAVGVEGLGYAISTNTARPIIEALVQNGYVIRPWLGVSLSTVDPFTAFRNNLPVDSGALIADIVTGSPAEKAGLKKGDIIIGVDDKDVTSAEELIQMIQGSQIGQQVKITFWRSGSKSTTTATLVARPSL
jgi:serine protease Do